MNLISKKLHSIDPTIFIYGEGWVAGNSPFPENRRAVKGNTAKLNSIAAFSDDLRDGIKGKWDNIKAKGFVSGAIDKSESVKFGIVASTRHPQVNYALVNYSKSPWAAEPDQCINYVSCHDDNTLFDRLVLSNPGTSEEDIIRMDKLSNTIVLTSQGVPFLHAGEEFLRTKNGIANSFNSPDAINKIDWARKKKYKEVFNYYKQVIALRKSHPAFRMPTTQMIQTHLKFIETNDPLIIAYQITGHANGDSWKDILVLFNGSSNSKMVTIPKGKWHLALEENELNEKGIKEIYSSQYIIPGTSTAIMYSY
jgi:pullulanase